MHHVNQARRKTVGVEESAKWQSAAVKKKQNPGGSPTNFMKDVALKKDKSIFH
jgi:hypothetical protein